VTRRFQMRLRLVAATILFVAFHLSTVEASAQSIPEPKPTARDLYVGCSLLVNDNDVLRNSSGKAERYSAARCAGQGLSAITYREGWSQDKDNKYRFCLPKTPEASQNPTRAMAYAYLEYFEANSFRVAAEDGQTNYTIAMIVKWPCKADK
jgi:hypothetical protein